MPSTNVFFYNTRMTRHLRWQNVVADTPHAALHAALFTVDRTGGYEIGLHDHDFYEMMLVTAGQGTHRLGDMSIPLSAGDLIFLRPSDAHAISVRPGAQLHWINIAFPSDLWRDFCAMAEPDGKWDSAPSPPAAHLDSERLTACRARFDLTLRRARLGALPPRRLDLCAFLAVALGFFAPAEPPAPDALTDDAPPWLTDACRTFAADPKLLRDGLPALRVRAGVSEAHLARVLKAATGQTPTEYVNALRLSRASALLTTTARPIIEIAGECGFTQLGYFYRLFKARYGQSPHAYRRSARRPVGG